MCHIPERPLSTKSPMRLRPINHVRSLRSSRVASGTAALLLRVGVLRQVTSSFVGSVIEESWMSCVLQC